MTKIEKILGVGVLIAIVIAVGGYTYPQLKSTVQNIAGVTNYDEVDATAMKIGGANGSRLGPIIAGTCSLISNAFSVTASTTKAMDCAVTGVVSGDIVQAWFPTSTITTGGWQIVGASASTTSGFVTLSVYNGAGTGASAIIPASLASSTEYEVMHPVTSVPGL